MYRRVFSHWSSSSGLIESSGKLCLDSIPSDRFERQACVASIKKKKKKKGNGNECYFLCQQYRACYLSELLVSVA
jgi:hypothetical protein